MLSKKTLKMYKFYYDKFLEYRKDNPNGNIEEDIEKWIGSLSVSTKTYKCVIKSALEYYFGKIKLFDNKQFNNLYESCGSHKVITEEEIHEIIDSIDNYKHKMIFKLMYLTGIRPSEIVDIKISDIDFNRNILIIPISKNYNNKREIQINEEIKSELLNYILKKYNNTNNYSSNQYLFDVNNKKMTIRGIQHVIKICSSRNNLFDVNPRLLRHAFVTHKICTDKIKDIQQQLGHRNLSSTQIYMD